jgi:hypothetical protein
MEMLGGVEKFPVVQKVLFSSLWKAEALWNKWNYPLSNLLFHPDYEVL